MSTSTSASRQRRLGRAPSGPGNGRCFNIFDPHLIARTGHHFDFCHAIARNLIQRGFTVRVCGHRASEAAVIAQFARLGADYIRVFSDLPHGSRPRVPPTRRDIQVIADRTASEMAGVVRADFSLFPTLTPQCFLAVASLEDPSPSAGLVHVEPSAFPSGDPTWELACRKARRRRLKVVIGSIDPLITESLRAAGGDLPIRDMPIPLDGRFKATYSGEAKTIGFFGHQRPERGLDLLPSLVKRLLESGYRVVLHDTAGHFGAGDVRPHLRLLTFVDDLSAEMTSCDVVVCPMEASHYEHRHSGIVWNAVASGVPVVLPKGTLSALRISRLRSSICYREHSVEGILSALSTLVSNYPSFAAAAERGAQLWKKKHGVDRFVQTVLDRLDTQDVPRDRGRTRP